VSVAGGGRCTCFRVLARASVLVLGGACLRLSNNANVSVVTLALVNTAAVVTAFFRRGWCGRRGGVGARRGFRAALPRVDPGGRRRVSVRVGGGRRSVRVLSCARPRAGARARRCVLASVNQRQHVGRGARAAGCRGGRRGFFSARVGVVGAAAGAQGTAPVRRCHVSTQVVVAACLFVTLGVGGRCMCASVLARASTQVLGGDAACASVTLIVTHLAL